MTERSFSEEVQMLRRGAPISHLMDLLAETGRAPQKGFVTPELTTLIASSHRVYAIDEKVAMGDGMLAASRQLAEPSKAAALQQLRAAAQADERGLAFQAALKELEATG